MKVGVIGCGAIGAEVARAAFVMDDVSGVVVFDIDVDATAPLIREGIATLAEDANAVVDAADIVIECANKGVVETFIPRALEQGKRVVLLTIGALADDLLRERLLALARAKGGKIHLPSGAVMGIDGVRGARESGLKAVTLVTTKPQEGLGRAVDKWTLLFNGPARDAVAQFPKNVNVAATLSLAGLGFDDTWVQVAVDPLATRNSHKVILEGDFGRARIEVENMPSPSNPKTSHLAALSTIALLRRLVSPMEVGS